jgi:hypothetical protein
LLGQSGLTFSTETVYEVKNKKGILLMATDIGNPKRKIRVPQRAAKMAAVTGDTQFVLVQTQDGHDVVFTPKLARELVKHLPEMAALAEGDPATQVREVSVMPIQKTHFIQ